MRGKERPKSPKPEIKLSGQSFTETSKIKILAAEKREFATGANRQDASGKGMPTLCSPIAERILSKHMEGGVEAGYDPRNWEHGLPLCSILNSLKRHIQDELEGKTDENHAAAIEWNSHIYVHTLEMIRRGVLPVELDDRPDYIPKKCPIHKKYKGKKLSMNGCDICQMIYDNRKKPWYRKQ